MEYRMPVRTKVNLEAASCAFTCCANIVFRTKDTRLLPRRISFTLWVLRIAERLVFESIPSISSLDSVGSFISPRLELMSS